MRLERTGPQLGGEVLGAVLFAVTLEDMQRLQVNWLKGGDVTCLMISARVMDEYSLLAPTANISLFAC